jgi:hypothetical protein
MAQDEDCEESRAIIPELHDELLREVAKIVDAMRCD